MEKHTVAALSFVEARPGLFIPIGDSYSVQLPISIITTGELKAFHSAHDLIRFQALPRPLPVIVALFPALPGMLLLRCKVSECRRTPCLSPCILIVARKHAFEP